MTQAIINEGQQQQQLLTDLGLANGLVPGLQYTQWLQGLTATPGASGNTPNLLTEPALTSTYLHGQRNLLIQARKMRPTIRVADGDLALMAYLTGEISCSAEELINDTGKCTISISYDNWLRDFMTNQTMLVEDLNLIIDPIPTRPNWRYRWGGKIVEIHIKRDDKGIHTIELMALHFREHAKRLLVAANPIFAPEIQIPKLWIMAGPVRTMCAITSFINLARLFEPGLTFVTNFFNPLGWINPLNPDAVIGLLPTGWPIQVAFVDTALDQSRWSAMGASWTSTWHDAYNDVLTSAGCVMKAYTYLTTDEDSPNHELAQLLTLAPELIEEVTGINLESLDTALASLVAPLRNCVVFSFEDKSGVSGPTGTVADGFLDTVAVTLDDLITPVTIDLTTGTTYDPGQILNGEPVLSANGTSQTYLIEQLLGVAPKVPPVIWWDATTTPGGFNGMINTDIFWHKGSEKSIMVGSHSPDLVNEAQTFGIQYALSQLQIVLTYGVEGGGGVFGEVGGGPTGGGAPVGAGLSSLYQGQLNDVLFAWERFTDPIRGLLGGDLAWQEHYEKGSSGTAYTLASIIDLQAGDWRTRTFSAFQADVIDGYPWIANVDYLCGDRVGFEQDGVIYVDNVTSIKYEWDWKKPYQPKIKIGQDTLKMDPFGNAFKQLGTLYNFVANVMGQNTIFTA